MEKNGKPGKQLTTAASPGAPGPIPHTILLKTLITIRGDRRPTAVLGFFALVDYQNAFMVHESCINNASLVRYYCIHSASILHS